MSSSRGIGAERTKVRDQQQQLGADERADDDVDAEIQDADGVETTRLRAHHGELQAEQVRRGEQDPVGVDGDRPQLKQSWIHACQPPACRES